MKLHVPLALALALPAPLSSAAEPMGRIFFTPDQRAQLDSARSKRVRTGAGTEKADEPPPPPTPEVVTYGGVVRRSDGKTTVWLNNRAVTGKDSPDAKMLEKVRPDGSVTLQSLQTGRNVNLRVGQRADLLSGRVEEGYRRTAPRPQEKPDAASSKPALESETERRKDDRERQENLDDAVRAMRDAAQARSANPTPQPAPAPPTAQTTPQGIVVVPAPTPAPAPMPAQPYR